MIYCPPPPFFPLFQYLKLGSMAHLLMAESPLPPHSSHPPTTLLRNLSSKTSYDLFSLCYCSISTSCYSLSPFCHLYPATILPVFCSLSRLTSLFLGYTLKPHPPDIKWKIKTASLPLSSFLPFSLHVTILGFNTFMSTCSCVGSTS